MKNCVDREATMRAPRTRGRECQIYYPELERADEVIA
jgi:hypothetical protein